MPLFSSRSDPGILSGFLGVNIEVEVDRSDGLIDWLIVWSTLYRFTSLDLNFKGVFFLKIIKPPSLKFAEMGKLNNFIGEIN